MSTPATAGTYTLELGEFSTGGYTDIKVSWGGIKAGNPSIKLEYSFNGGSYVPVEGWADVKGYWSPVNNTSKKDWAALTTDLVGVSLPTCFNKGSVKLRWTYESTDSSTTYAIDDITVTGVPYGETSQSITSSTSASTTSAAISTFSWASRSQDEEPFTVAGNKNTSTFYEQDGVKMQWGKFQADRMDMYKQRVTPEFQAKRTFSLGQQFFDNTTINKFTTTSLNLDKPVVGLSFTLHDVDETPTSNRDVVKVVAYGLEGTPIYPKKQHVQVTSSNEFVTVGNEVILRSMTDPEDMSPGGYNPYEIQPYSDEADITVTFPEAVNRVEIHFSNSVPNGIYLGQQEIAISDISWRNISLPVSKVDFTSQSGIDPTPLPVTLVSFEVKKMGDGAKLEWSTASEINNERFVVERSFDGKTFEAIGEVKGAGNSATLLKHSFLDRAPKAGTNYYRLTQHDFDGESEVSKTIYLTYTGTTSSSALSTYPNPTTDDLTIKPSASSEADQTFYILNTAGSLVKTVVLPKNQTSVQLSVRELASGLYLVKSDKAVSKFFKQ